VAANYKRDTRDLELYFGALDIAKTFQTETGYLTRPGVTTLSAFAGPRLYPAAGKVLRRVDLSFLTSQTRDKYAGLWETDNFAGVGFILERGTSFGVQGRYATEVFRGMRFDISGFNVSGRSQLTKQLSIRGLFDRSGAIYYSEDPFQGRSNSASLTVVYLPSDNLHAELSLTYADFAPSGGAGRLYEYTIARSKLTYQVNRYLFFRGIVEYNSFRRQMLTDLLGSFTYIPGTVLHLGYGSLYEKARWEDDGLVRDRRFLETRRGLFFKASYLWRM